MRVATKLRARCMSFFRRLERQKGWQIPQILTSSEAGAYQFSDVFLGNFEMWIPVSNWTAIILSVCWGSLRVNYIETFPIFVLVRILLSHHWIMSSTSRCGELCCPHLPPQIYTPWGHKGSLTVCTAVVLNWYCKIYGQTTRSKFVL